MLCLFWLTRTVLFRDGHHRVRACHELNLPPKTETIEFDSEIQEKKFVCEINLKRRHLNDFQKAELALKLEGIRDHL